MTDKQYFEKDINVPCKEQIMIDGVDVNRCIDFNKRDKVSCYHILYDKCNENPNCYFKQLARKTQECEELKGKLRDLELKNTTLQNRYQQLDGSITECDRYRKALEGIEELAKDGLNPICYKSNCSRCKCYNGDDCKAGMISLINNYFTENGEFADGNGDFAEALEDLLDKERSRCNRALPVSKKILDIINKAKGEGNV